MLSLFLKSISRNMEHLSGYLTLGDAECKKLSSYSRLPNSRLFIEPRKHPEVRKGKKKYYEVLRLTTRLNLWFIFFIYAEERFLYGVKWQKTHLQDFTT